METSRFDLFIANYTTAAEAGARALSEAIKDHRLELIIMIKLSPRTDEDYVSITEKAIAEIKSIYDRLDAEKQLISSLINDEALRRRCKKEAPEIIQYCLKIRDACDAASQFFSQALPIIIKDNSEARNIFSGNYHHFSNISGSKLDLIRLEKLLEIVRQHNSRPRQRDTTTCPVCKGTGGVRECYKCFGKGVIQIEL